MKDQNGRRRLILSDVQKWVLVAAVLVGILTPFLVSGGAVFIMGLIVPAVAVVWVPELAVVLMQDALGIVQAFAHLAGVTLAGGVSFLVAGIALFGYALLALRRPLNLRALLSPLAFLNYALTAVVVLALLRGGIPYGLDKFLRFLGFNLLGFVLCSITPPARRRWLIYGFLLVGVAGLLSLVAAASQPRATSRVVAFGGNPIWTARLLCAAGLVALWWPRASWWAKIPLALVFFGGSVLTGSRGPLLGVAIVLLAVLLIRPFLAADRRKAGQALLLLLIVVLVFGAGYAGLRALALQQARVSPDSPFVRIFAPTEETETSTEVRLALFRAAWDMFLRNPIFGAGLGGFSREFHFLENPYPHNILLEFAAEMGVVGVIFFAAIVILAAVWLFPFLRTASSPLRQDVVVGLMLLLFAFVNAQVSGDIIGNKMIWFFLGYLNNIWSDNRILSRPHVVVRQGKAS